VGGGGLGFLPGESLQQGLGYRTGYNLSGKGKWGGGGTEVKGWEDLRGAEQKYAEKSQPGSKYLLEGWAEGKEEADCLCNLGKVTKSPKRGTFLRARKWGEQM